jgi:hypothetical protein
MASADEKPTTFAHADDHDRSPYQAVSINPQRQIRRAQQQRRGGHGGTRAAP